MEKKFFQSLQLLGPNFELMAAVVFAGNPTPGQLRLKYEREERERPHLLFDALEGKFCSSVGNTLQQMIDFLGDLLDSSESEDNDDGPSQELQAEDSGIDSIEADESTTSSLWSYWIFIKD